MSAEAGGLAGVLAATRKSPSMWSVSSAVSTRDVAIQHTRPSEAAAWAAETAVAAFLAAAAAARTAAEEER